ncbi:uncharacterized protein LOC119397684 [Rhipicephalus sanguineus]|uniref:uncharacterized protein LOC119397684 n=1 Tax=Rhipicephalus sanguineus TaxID=34632 RepID=UPI001892F19D|nr:uncharacterized protein LOC119397684 [Rhipicephalus sanguineus]
MSNLKREMQAWLSEKGVPWSDDMVKPELMKLIKTAKVDGNSYRIYCMAAAARHFVLRLPPYHCQLNPIELVWNDTKRFVSSANRAFKMEELNKHAAEAIAQVNPQKWKNYVKHAGEEEEKTKQMDHIIDDVVDDEQAVVVNLGEDTTSDEEDIMDDEHSEWQ